MISLNPTGFVRAVCSLTGIVLTILLINGARGGPATVFADDTDSPVGPRPVVLDPTVVFQQEPAARIQVVILSVDVSNDRDGFWRGAGDIELTTNIWRCTNSTQSPCSASENNQAELLAEDVKSFSADSGEAVSLNRVIPQIGDELHGPNASAEGGIAVFDGQRYLLMINGFESDHNETLDVGGGDFMGGVQRVLDSSNSWAIGTYTREPAAPFEDTSLPGRGLLCAGCGGIIVGDYLVTYQIRLAPLPDMHPSALSVKAPGGPDTQVCATIQNLGAETAEAYGMIFTIDGEPKSQIGGGLPANQSHEDCVQVGALAVGTHSLAVSVDPDRAIPESNEGNNVFARDYVRRVIDDIVVTGGGAVLEPAQPPVVQGGQPNLQVSAIRVKGKNPSGQNDCDPGQNDVTVVLKNQGDGQAENLNVQLIVDGKDKEALNKPVASLSAGQELNVVFNAVDLKPGERPLVATVEGKSSNAELDGSKAELKVIVACKNE